MRFHLDLDPSGLDPRPAPPVPQQASAATTATTAPPPDPSPPSSRCSPSSAPPSPLPVLHAAVPAWKAGAPPRAVVASEPGWYSATPGQQGTLVIPAGCRVTGDCRAAQVWVAGEVAGNVFATAGTLVVAEGACVRGRLEGAGHVVVAGQVKAARGQPAVLARGRLDIACTAHITGRVVHDVIAIYEGARIDGDIVGAPAAHLPPA